MIIKLSIQCNTSRWEQQETMDRFSR